MGRLKFAAVVLLISWYAAGCGGSGSSSPPPVVSISISPTSANLGVGGVQQFTPAVTGSSNAAVTWQVNGVPGGNATVGTITASGLYMAPNAVPNPATVTVTAVSQADATKTASATVTIIGPAVSVSVSPSAPSVVVNQIVFFSAMVTGTSNPAVTWQVNDVPGGNSTVGMVSSTGLYTAPSNVPVNPSLSNPESVTVAAVSQADPTKFGTATVTVLATNSQPQGTPIKLGTTGGNSKDFVISGQRITCCSGTLGGLVSRAGSLFILSNNHVLARSNVATPPEPITQPGLVDNLCNPGVTVANLTQFADLKTSNVDAALAAVVSGAVDPSGTILELGASGGEAPPADTAATAAVNMSVAKSGRTTGLTCSTISATNTNVRVDYSGACGGSTAFSVTFTAQVIVGGGTFSDGGDSGSLIVSSQTAQPVALLFAGSSTDTVGNPIQPVLSALKDSGGNVPTIVGGAQHTVACPATTSAAPAAQQAASLTPQEIARATAAKDRHAHELMNNPAVLGLGVGASADQAGQGAIVVYVSRSQPRAAIPAVLDGVRTRIVPADQAPPPDAAPQDAMAMQAQPLADAEVQKGIAAKEKYVNSMMQDPAIIGVGVGASEDSPSEPAIVVFVETGKTHAPIPVTLDDVRTKIVVTDRFRAIRGQQGSPGPCGQPK